LIEVLQIPDLQLKKIVNSEPSQIAEKLGIDPYIEKIIFKETKKSS